MIPTCRKKKKPQGVETTLPTPPSPPFPLHKLTPQKNLQRAWAKLKPGEKIDSEQIQRFIWGSTASVYPLELTACDFKCVIGGHNHNFLGKTSQFRHAGCPERWDYKSQWVSCTLFQKESKKRRNKIGRKKGKKKNRRKSLANFQLSQIDFLIEGAPPVE